MGRKAIAGLLSVTMCASIFAGCGGSSENNSSSQGNAENKTLTMEPLPMEWRWGIQD